jgi:hypothetical protein
MLITWTDLNVSTPEERKHPVNNAAREALGGMVGPRLMTKAGLL